MKRSKLLVWTDPEGCSGCLYCFLDYDQEPYCTHPEVLVYHRFGVNLNKALTEFCETNKDGILRLRVKKTG